ncbi:MAG: type IV secretory system conjugative DNA transfer family protein [Clostridia bacterium]|nr:type IV secretory system conjugative DNA transfer family protein [Clostridia bacterium]
MKKEGLRKIGAVGIITLVCFALANVISVPVLFFVLGYKGVSIAGAITYAKWTVFFFITMMLIANVFLSQKFLEGKGQEILFFTSSALLMSEALGYIIYCLVRCKFVFGHLDWYGFFLEIINLEWQICWIFYAIVFLAFVLIFIIYVTFIDRRLILFARGGLAGKGKLKQINSNLENSRWMTPQERDKVFKPAKWSKLSVTKKDGIPIMAELTNRNKDLNIVFNSPCHAIVIGSTGSGKTTTFVSPMIQILAASAAGSSMIVTDPKGELFSMHSQFLKDRGYDVKVVDLRDTYSSYRWNPLDMIWDGYQKYLFAHNDAFVRDDDVKESGLTLGEDESQFVGLDTWYEFNGKAFANYESLVQAIKVFKKKTYDEVYEDLNDLVSVLIPVENDKDPMWEKGARSIVLSVLLGMLEDSADERLGMTKEKFNFFNMTKILQNSTDDYLELRNYFAGRSILSKALSLSKQVCDAAETTRASYMSIVYEKLTMFNDAGICALTSASDFTSEQLAYKPTALFLKIPDEKDTRHNLAAIFILNIYKTLIKVASAKADLTLDRNVFFIMDEFGNMPKIEKFDKFITVGRSRKIWFVMIIQSYAQLNNVYGDTVADIVKGNCGIKMFIGSNDMGTCKEYSELCGNITVVTTSTSGSSQSDDVNISAQTQVRPLIYPSELQRLNHPGDIGHSIIVTFGNFPLKTYFSPSFKVPFYKFAKMDTSDTDRYFDENAILYDVKKRNEIVLAPEEGEEEQQGFAGIQVASDSEMKIVDESVVEEQQVTAAADNTEAKSENEIIHEEDKGMDNETNSQMQELMAKFAEFKSANGTQSLEDFFRQMAGADNAPKEN